MNFGLVVVDSRSVSMILDDIDDKPCHSIERLESIFSLPSGQTLRVATDTGLCAHTEEEGGDVFSLQNALFRELSDERDKALFWRMGSLEDSDPLLEPSEELLPQLLSLGFCGRLRGLRIGDRGLSADATEVIEKVVDPNAGIRLFVHCNSAARTLRWTCQTGLIDPESQLCTRTGFV